MVAWLVGCPETERSGGFTKARPVLRLYSFCYVPVPCLRFRRFSSPPHVPSYAHLNMLLESTSLRCTVAFFLKRGKKNLTIPPAHLED
jgi:hypothetical protein